LTCRRRSEAYRSDVSRILARYQNEMHVEQEADGRRIRNQSCKAAGTSCTLTRRTCKRTFDTMHVACSNSSNSSNNNDDDNDVRDGKNSMVMPRTYRPDYSEPRLNVLHGPLFLVDPASTNKRNGVRNARSLDGYIYDNLSARREKNKKTRRSMGQPAHLLS
jgi:hypothetical protein